MCVSPSSSLGFRRIPLGECPPADVYVLGFINRHTDTSRAHVGARPPAAPPTEAPAPWFQGSAACEAGGGGELGGREAPSWRGSSHVPRSLPRGREAPSGGGAVPVPRSLPRAREAPSGGGAVPIPRSFPRNCVCVGSGFTEHLLCAAPALDIWGPFQHLGRSAAGNFL